MASDPEDILAQSAAPLATASDLDVNSAAQTAEVGSSARGSEEFLVLRPATMSRQSSNATSAKHDEHQAPFEVERARIPLGSFKGLDDYDADSRSGYSFSEGSSGGSEYGSVLALESSSESSSDEDTTYSDASSGVGEYEDARYDYHRRNEVNSDVSSLTLETGIGSYLDAESHATSVTQGTHGTWEAGESLWGASNAATAGGADGTHATLEGWSLLDRTATWSGRSGKKDFGHALSPRPVYSGAADVRGRSVGSSSRMSPPSVISIPSVSRSGRGPPPSLASGLSEKADPDKAARAIAQFFGGPSQLVSRSSTGGTIDKGAVAVPTQAPDIAKLRGRDDKLWRWTVACANVLGQGLAGFAGGFSLLYLLSRASRARAAQVLRPAVEGEVVELGLHA